MDNGLKTAISILGSGANLARKLNVTKATVYSWQGVTPMPWIKRVSDVTGIPMLELHPDTREALEVERLRWQAEADENRE